MARILQRGVMPKRSVRVLLVEDDPSLGPILSEVLAYYGHSPMLANSAESAKAILASRHRIEVMILDLELGDSRGEELVREIRTIDTKVPAIIVHSAQPIDDLRRAAAAVGAEAILQKPCSAQRMIEAIDLAIA